MTLSLKTLGAKMVSPMQCHVITEVMPDWRALWRQRMRWQRGALENIGAYGLTRATLRYWLQQIGIGYGTIALNAYLLLMLITLLAADSFEFALVLGRHRDDLRRRARRHGLARRLARAGCSPLPLVIEIGYDLVLQAVYVKSLFDIATGREAGWNYVPREAVAHMTPLMAGILLPVRPADSAVVPGPRRLRGHQHPRLRRPQPRQADPAPPRVDHGRAAGRRGVDPRLSPIRLLSCFRVSGSCPLALLLCAKSRSLHAHRWIYQAGPRKTPAQGGSDAWIGCSRSTSLSGNPAGPSHGTRAAKQGHAIPGGPTARRGDRRRHACGR